MIRRLLLISVGCILLTGCYMAPLALIGPATSGFSTASIMQASISTTTNYMVKVSTGKSVGEHALSVLDKEIVRNSIDKEILKQSYFPEKKLIDWTVKANLI